MLICNTSWRPPRTAILADLAETATASDDLTSGNIVFATIVDDPASVNDSIDAFLGTIINEPAGAGDTVDAATISLTDPNFASVVLLLGFNGVNGATSAIDESS